jgi:hypothetical protein
MPVMLVLALPFTVPTEETTTTSPTFIVSPVTVTGLLAFTVTAEDVIEICACARFATTINNPTNRTSENVFVRLIKKCGEGTRDFISCRITSIVMNTWLKV